MTIARAVVACVVSASATGCGYHLAHAPADPLGPFSVVAGRAYVPDATASAAAEEGARAELSRAGALSTGSEGGSIEIEILRIDEAGEGIAVGAAGAPLGRGVRITVVGRASLRRAGSNVVERDTGDMRASEVMTRADGAARGMAVAESATRVASRRLGEMLVRRVLGFPEPSEP
ncbi:Hypothetical protein A7982_02576 [Minicystis rosea]|nr:Hypothetical protein A7982_02576 [Minicystis rosea]